MPKYVPVVNAMFTKIDKTLGRLAAVVKSYIDNNEMVGVFGPKGRVEHTPGDVANALGIGVEDATTALIALVMKGYAQLTPKQTVKAA